MLFCMLEKKGKDLNKEAERVFAEVGEKPVIKQAQQIVHKNNTGCDQCR